MMTITRLAVVLAVACVATAAPEEGDARAQTVRFVRGYTGYNQTGPSIEFFTYSPDLSLDGANNALYSGNQTGVWVYYTDTEYLGASCYEAGISETFNFDSTCAGQISSLRFAGDPDELNGDFINFYSSTNFVGGEFTASDNSGYFGELDENVSSFIISGSSEWTLFTGLQFSGGMLCVGPKTQLNSQDGTVLNYGFYPSLSALGLPDNSVRSVLKTCLNRQPQP